MPSATASAPTMACAVLPGFSSSQAQYSRHCLAARAGTVPVAPSSSIGPSSWSMGWWTARSGSIAASMIKALSVLAVPHVVDRLSR